jgi:L-histidine Nalpha-methyltransferase
MGQEIRSGMNKVPKTVPCKYFYDPRGSQLFDAICQTPEYYPTRTELSILDHSAAEIMRFFGLGPGDLVELGSGSCLKISRLLEASGSFRRGWIRYVPVDICEESLLESSQQLMTKYDGLEILAVVADFTRPLGMLPRERKLITFLGSTIGNFAEDDAALFLKTIRDIMNPEDRLLLGIDMLKPARVLEEAYNDRQGLTAAFNLNVLAHINGALHADFDLGDFEHLAFFNPDMEQVEMHLKARRSVRVYIADLDLVIQIRKDETLQTEICRKFTRESADRLFARAGLARTRSFTDAKRWFSLVELEANGRRGLQGSARIFSTSKNNGI